MDIVTNIMFGFGVATTATNLFVAFLGAVIGTFIGILPGLGTSATIAILLPLTFGMNPATALILMAGIYTGARYGGAITSILLNVPGETSAVVTCLDGYPLALQGRAGPAVGLAAISSFVAGQASTVGLMLLAPLLARWALGFGPPEYFSLTLFGLCLVTSLTGTSLVKGMLAAALGLLLATVGADTMSSTPRLIFGWYDLIEGISFVSAAVGLFSLSEILINIEKQVKLSLMEVPKKLLQLLPTRHDIVQCIGTWVRSSIIGFLVGVLPGAGASIASFLSYTTAKAVSKTPERFGKGAVEGLAAAESADNACVGGALVPMLTLGIPGSSSTAMMMAALIMIGVRPGPFLLKEHPDVFWGVVASLYISNILLLIINLPLIPIVVKLIRVPYYLLYMVILIATFVGVYSLNDSTLDIWIMGVFGLLGYAFKKLDYPPAALLLAFILGPMVERALRQSLVISKGDFSIFLTRPVSAVLLSLALLALFAPWLQQRWWGRQARA
jgi:putative tricarboxylic transport membrane protein